jgi:hypothetical protein
MTIKGLAAKAFGLSIVRGGPMDGRMTGDKTTGTSLTHSGRTVAIIVETFWVVNSHGVTVPTHGIVAGATVTLIDTAIPRCTP